MKKLLTAALALVLCLAPAAPAFAADAVCPSRQSLVVDGYSVEEFTAYAINGYNYFKLRDIAALLSGTAGEFAVDWDAETGTVFITTGGSYVFVGGELERGRDLSSTAVPSTQTIVIDGRPVDNLSVYNIGWNNYFKLRDLGEALGFAVDYDEAWDTVILTSPKAEYLLSGETTTDAEGSVTITYTYDEAGRMTGYSADDGSTNSVYTYNEYGVLVSVKCWGGEGENYWVMETSYNGRGAVLCDRSRYGDTEDVSKYTYNSLGILTGSRSESTGSDFCDVHECVYDDMGRLVLQTDSYNWSDGTYETAVTIFKLDEQGRTVTYVMEGSGVMEGLDWDENYELISVLEPFSYVIETDTVYEADRTTETSRTVYTESDGTQSVTEHVCVSVYDENGNLLTQRDADDGGETVTRERFCTYSEAGRLLTDVLYDNGSEDPDSVETYTYDDAGRTLSDRTDYPNGDYNCMTYTYDAGGNCIADSYESHYSEYDWDTDTTTPVVEKSSSTYTYDDAGRVILYVSDTADEHYERALTYDDFGNLIHEIVTVNGSVTETTVYAYTGLH